MSTKKTADDISGKDRITRNTIISWLSLLVMIAVGFIMPRIIDSQLGQESLGFWDFSWSLVNYLSLAGVGIGSGVSRYVSKYMTTGDEDSLSRVVISSYVLQTLVVLSGFILFYILITGTSFMIPDTLSSREDNIAIVLLLAASICIQLSLSPSRGVINGCHRWDITNIINVASRLISSALMAATILLGGSLLDMAVAYFFVSTIAEIIRCTISFRVCQPLTLSVRHFDFGTSIKMMKFGSSQFATESLPAFYAQAISIVIAQSLGPASLAIFARTQAIVKYIELFISRHTRILVPTAASLKEDGRIPELQQLFINSTKFSLALTIPALLVYLLCGDEIIRLWMGDKYIDNGLIYTLCAGYFLPISMSAAMNILIGLNKHSRILWINIAVILTGSALLFWLADREAGLDLAILGGIMVVTLTITYGLLIPIYCSRILKIRLVHFFHQCIAGAVACNIPMIAVTIVFFEEPIETRIQALALAAPLSLILYWKFLLTASTKERLVMKARAIGGTKSLNE